MSNITLGDRMKRYEAVSQVILMRRMPIIVRLDGKAFHNFCKGRNKPFDKNMSLAMQFTTQFLVKNIQGCKFGYTQSDEISLLITDYDTLDTESWFDSNLQKIVAVSASYCTHIFNRQLHSLDLMDKNRELKPPKDAFFDARAFNVPKEDVCNYFIWRQQDCMRNAISMAAQSMFSPKELYKKSSEDKIKMLYEKNIDFHVDYDKVFRYGATYYKSLPYGMHVRFETDCDIHIPDFKDDRNYIERFVFLEKEQP